MVSRLRVHGLTISLDGYAAGPSQSLEHPMGVGVDGLHAWVIGTRAWLSSHGMEGGEEGTLDDTFAAAGQDGIGATIMGRNMFGPVRGPWPVEAWNGWWGS
ncbi:MAG: dihydrofolate reductase, partial [Acidimicrobiia bacterium]|nr:dihydrofolate reductase [Acidimicrobiia bacterium]